MKTTAYKLWLRTHNLKSFFSQYLLTLGGMFLEQVLSLLLFLRKCPMDGIKPQTALDFLSTAGSLSVLYGYHHSMVSSTLGLGTAHESALTNGYRRYRASRRYKQFSNCVVLT